MALPGVQGLLKKPQGLYAMVLSPTRELAIQIAEQFEALGSGIGVKCAVLVGGIDMMAQAIALGRRPHVIVGTPGRVVDHLSNTKVSHCYSSLYGIYADILQSTHLRLKCAFVFRHASKRAVALSLLCAGLSCCIPCHILCTQLGQPLHLIGRCCCHCWWSL